MLKVYDKNGNHMTGISHYYNARIEKELNITDTLLFTVPKLVAKLFEEEGYIETKEYGRFVIKEKNFGSEGLEIVCKQDLEDLLTWVESKSYITMTFSAIMDDLLDGTGWVVECDETDKRTVTGTNMSILELIAHAVDTFKYDIKFDNINKVIHVADELGEDRGVYFHDEVNLKSLTTTSDTYDFATRLIPVGFDGMGIELINDGISYVENHSYSDKIITKYWQDERYTVIENLKRDAIKRLEKICKPLRSYQADIADLKGFEYNIGDTITLVDRKSNTREKQRIMQKTIWLHEPEKNSVVIANRPRYIDEEQDNLINDIRTGFEVAKASLELFENSIQGKVTEIEGIVEDVDEELAEFKGQTEATITRHQAEFEAISTELSGKVSQTVYDTDYEAITDNYTEFRQQYDNFTSTVQIGGGNNLIRNSVGYGGLNYWSEVVEGIEYGTTNWILQGDSKHGWLGNGTIRQDISLIAGMDYTLSVRIKKHTEAGTIKLLLCDVETEGLIHEACNIGREVADGQYTYQFNTGDIAEYRLVLEIEDTSTVNKAEITDLMLARGLNYDVWSQANGETYTLNVKIDGQGIEVHNADGTGKTIMSPNEFAGYYSNQKVFTLNKDITEVMGLEIGGKGLFMRPIKFVQKQDSIAMVWTGW